MRGIQPAEIRLLRAVGGQRMTDSIVTKMEIKDKSTVISSSQKMWNDGS